MAYPGTYDISYYKGDTFEFRIYPKDTSGTTFNLSGYLPPKFTISNTRGGTEGVDGKITNIDGYSEIINNEYILCAITPTNGDAMTLSSYVYDVEIGKKSSPYNYVYTLLSGKISVTEQVNADPLLSAPNAPTSPVVSNLTSTTAKLSWTAPSGGSEVTGYKLYLTTDPISNPLTTTTLVTTTTTPATLEYTFTGLTPSHLYGFSVTAYNAGGESGFVAGTGSTTA